jgi:capsular exopolysaccharide synthesis family protein
MDLQQYLRALRKFWWVILMLTLLGAAYGLRSASQAVPSYRASLTFFVVTSSPDPSVSAAVQGDQFAQRRVNSYVALLSTDRLAEMVAAHPDLDVTPRQVRRMIAGTGDLDTVLLTATVTSTSRTLAQRVAEVLATEFVELVDQVETPEGVPRSVHLEVVSGPSVGQVPTRAALTTAIPTFLGFLVGLGLAVFLEVRDLTLRSDEQLRELDTRPVLGTIPFDRRMVDDPLATATDGSSAVAESFRQLRTNLQFLTIDRPLQVLVVTSSLADEGKSVTSANIALSLLRSGRPTLVIEADLRRPKVAEYFGLDRAVGLTDVLAGRVGLDDALQRWKGSDLVILPSGHLPPNPSELLGSEAMHHLIDRLRTRFEVVVIDSPPVLPVTDAAVLGAHSDGIVLVVRAGRATRHQVEESMRSLRAVNANVLGFVMTRVQLGRSSEYATYRRPGATPHDRAQRWWVRLRALAATGLSGRNAGTHQHRIDDVVLSSSPGDEEAPQPGPPVSTDPSGPPPPRADPAEGSVARSGGRSPSPAAGGAGTNGSPQVSEGGTERWRLGEFGDRHDFPR